MKQPVFFLQNLGLTQVEQPLKSMESKGKKDNRKMSRRFFLKGFKDETSLLTTNSRITAI